MRLKIIAITLLEGSLRAAYGLRIPLKIPTVRMGHTDSKYAALQLDLQVRPSSVAGNKRARHMPRHGQGALNTRAAMRIPRRVQNAKSALQNRLLPCPGLVRGWAWEPTPGWARRGALHLNGQPCTFSVPNSGAYAPMRSFLRRPVPWLNAATAHKSNSFGVLTRPRFRLARILLRRCDYLQNSGGIALCPISNRPSSRPKW